MIERATFTAAMLQRQPPRGLDVTTTLSDFAIITYAVPPERLATHVPAPFVPEVVETKAGLRALVSVVPFRDTSFRLAGLPTPGLSFGQTNYRAYLRDPTTGQRKVWFFGTALDSMTVLVPRHAWRLPWHRARMSFDCEYDHEHRRFRRYAVRSVGSWGGADLELSDTGEQMTEADGFPDAETALVVLTHPLQGVFRRRDGAIGTYSVWHDRLMPSLGSCRRARFEVLDTLGLVPFADQGTPYNVLMLPETEFTIYLPPRRLAVEASDPRTR